MVKAPFFVDPPTPQLGRRSRGAGGGQKRAARHQTVDADRSKRGGLGTDMENHWQTIGKPLENHWKLCQNHWKTIVNHGTLLEHHWKALENHWKIIGRSLETADSIKKNWDFIGFMDDYDS